MRSKRLPVSLVLVGLGGLATAFAFASLAACSGASGTTIGDIGSGTDASSNDAAATTQPDGGTTPVDGGGVKDDGGSVVDAGLVVTEKPAPDCNDLTQAAGLVKATASNGSPPNLPAITTITPGLYVVTSITDYGGSVPIQDGASRTTAFFTPTKEYYVRDDATTTHQVYNLDWKITGGKLVRNIICAQTPIGSPTVVYGIGGSPNGFTVLVDGLANNRTQAVRYEHSP